MVTSYFGSDTIQGNELGCKYFVWNPTMPLWREIYNLLSAYETPGSSFVNRRTFSKPFYSVISGPIIGSLNVDTSKRTQEHGMTLDSE